MIGRGSCYLCTMDFPSESMFSPLKGGYKVASWYSTHPADQASAYRHKWG